MSSVEINFLKDIIKSDFKDDDIRLIYSDWLHERNDKFASKFRNKEFLADCHVSTYRYKANPHLFSENEYYKLYTSNDQICFIFTEIYYLFPKHLKIFVFRGEMNKMDIDDFISNELAWNRDRLLSCILYHTIIS